MLKKKLRKKQGRLVGGIREQLAKKCREEAPTMVLCIHLLLLAAAIASFQRKRNGFRNGENSALSPHGRVHSVTTTTRTHAAAAAAFKGQEEE